MIFDRKFRRWCMKMFDILQHSILWGAEIESKIKLSTKFSRLEEVECAAKKKLSLLDS